MTVMVLEKCPASLKGALSRWLIEIKTGVLIGDLSARVRDELWKIAVMKVETGTVIQAWNDNSPQGFTCRMHGDSEREFVDLEGITLSRTRGRKSRVAKKWDGRDKTS